ncbi:MAG: hypothetical protein AAF600_04700 [Bacteroidota bacterium]
MKKYYPLGINRTVESGLYFKYDGIKKLDKLITENIHKELNSSEKWRQKTTRWEDELRCKLISTTYGQEPSFSSYLEIEKDNFRDWIFEKRLHFTISILGPFYTIYGVDTAAYVIKGQKSATELLKQRNRYYWKAHRIIIYPIAEYKKKFEEVRKLIENEFTGYKFIPYGIYSSSLDGLEVGYSDENLDRIFNGLFNRHFDFDAPVLREINDYGYEQWESSLKDKDSNVPDRE